MNELSTDLYYILANIKSKHVFFLAFQYSLTFIQITKQPTTLGKYIVFLDKVGSPKYTELYYIFQAN